MIFATLYKWSTGYIEGNYSGPPRFCDTHKKPIPALGSDGVIIFDGRFSIEHCADLARVHCRNCNFIGFTIERGERFTQSNVIRKMERVIE